MCVVTTRSDPPISGVRYDRDCFRQPDDPTPPDGGAARKLFLEWEIGRGRPIQTPHPRRTRIQSVSHVMIRLDAKVVRRLSPTPGIRMPENSAFNGQWVVNQSGMWAGSVNNFRPACVQPRNPDRRRSNESVPTAATALPVRTHTCGVLTDWMRRFDFPASHITTHAYVDLGGERADPAVLTGLLWSRGSRPSGCLCLRLDGSGHPKKDLDHRPDSLACRFAVDEACKAGSCM